MSTLKTLSTSTELKSSRRDFLKSLGIVGGGLIMAVPLSACAAKYPYAENQKDKKQLQANAYLQITQNNEFHFYMGRSEMGQGTYTGLTTLIAEELDVAPSNITVHHATAHEAFTNTEYGMQATGGSTSMKISYLPMRQAAANTKAVIKQAAALILKVDINSLQTQNGKIISDNKKIPYGEFVDLASNMDAPEQAPLKDKSDFKYIGKDAPRLDGLAKSNGSAQFGIDVDFPGLYRAALLRCPVARGTVKSVNDKDAMAMPGVKKVVSIYNGVAVIADNYWIAKQALTKLKVEWDLPETLSGFSSGTGKQLFADALNSDDYEVASDEGDGKDALEHASNIITADYWAPYLAHATMEPMNCTVKIENDEMDVWVGSQSPGIAQGLAAFYGDIDKDSVRIHSTFLGGGFGRRSASDFVGEAAAIAKESGLAIQLVWSREDDTRHDLYRPAAMARFNIGLDKQGNIESWVVRRSGPNIMSYTIDEALDAMAPGFLPNAMVDWMSKRGYGVFDGLTVDHSSVEGLYEDYAAPNKEVQHVTVDPGLPCGFWRSVGHSFSGFFKESMMDEIAHSQKQDPVLYRLKHVKENKRLTNVIKLAAEKSNWKGRNKSAKRQLGFAAHTSFLASVAQVADVSIENGQIKVHKVTCVIDCGSLVNPDIVKAQMESGIIFGLTAALHGEITLKDGAVQQSNFHDYPMLRMHETPEIDEKPTGVGEPGTPPIAAAVANAIFAINGQRLRSLPLKLS